MEIEAVAQIIASVGTAGALLAWVFDLRQQLEKEREESAKLQQRLQEIYQQQIEYMRYQQVKGLGEATTRPVVPMYDPHHPASGGD